MTQVHAGELIAKKAGSEEILAVSEGFAEITGDHVSILTDNAANSADIDEAAAEEARAKAEKRLKEGDISEEEAKVLNQAILYSAAQIRAKRRRGCSLCQPVNVEDLAVGFFRERKNHKLAIRPACSRKTFTQSGHFTQQKCARHHLTANFHLQIELFPCHWEAISRHTELVVPVNEPVPGSK